MKHAPGCPAFRAEYGVCSCGAHKSKAEHPAPTPGAPDLPSGSYNPVSEVTVVRSGAPDIPALIVRLRAAADAYDNYAKHDFERALLREAADALAALSASHEALKQERDEFATLYKTGVELGRRVAARSEAAEAQVAALTQERDELLSHHSIDWKSRARQLEAQVAALTAERDALR